VTTSAEIIANIKASNPAQPLSFTVQAPAGGWVGAPRLATAGGRASAPVPAGLHAKPNKYTDALGKGDFSLFGKLAKSKVTRVGLKVGKGLAEAELAVHI